MPCFADIILSNVSLGT